MVRLIKLIEQGLGHQDPKDQDVEGAEVFCHSQNTIAAFNIPLLYHQSKKTNQSVEDNVVKVKRLQELYSELVNTAIFVIDCLDQEQIFDKDSVDIAVNKLIHEFEQDPYNELLIFSFSYTDYNYLISHMVNDAILSVAFANSLGVNKEDLKDVGIAAFLHDMGMQRYKKIYSQPKKLSNWTMKKIRKHPYASVEVGRSLWSDQLADIILGVHEREQGQGYPLGKEGKNIHPWSKIISICDTYEAMIHPRAFRSDVLPFDAMKFLIKTKGELFDEWLVKQFVQYFSIYPIGSIVYLSTGDIALVKKSNPELPTKPIVQVILNSDFQVADEFSVIDLSLVPSVHIMEGLDRQKEAEIVKYLNQYFKE